MPLLLLTPHTKQLPAAAAVRPAHVTQTDSPHQQHITSLTQKHQQLTDTDTPSKTCMQHSTCQACASPLSLNPSELLLLCLTHVGLSDTSTLQKKKTKWIEEPIKDVTMSPKHIYKEDKEYADKVDWKAIEKEDKKVRDTTLTGTWGQGTGQLAGDMTARDSASVP